MCYADREERNSERAVSAAGEQERFVGAAAGEDELSGGSMSCQGHTVYGSECQDRGSCRTGV